MFANKLNPEPMIREPLNKNTMSTLKKILLFAVLAFAVVACSQESDANYAPTDAPYAEEALSDLVSNMATQSKSEEGSYGTEESLEQAVEEPKGGFDRKIIYTGNLRMQVEDIEVTHKNVLAMLDKYGAYVASDNVDNSYGWQENTMSLRVPKEKFYDFLAAVEKEAIFIDSKSVNASDVSEEYYDLKTRIENKKAAEAQYLEVLKKARTIAEILEVQNYLNNVREEIERMEGRIKYLDSQTSYSTLTLTFWQDKEVEPRKTPSFWNKLGDGAGNGWDGLMTFIIGMVTVWPLWLIGIGLFILIRWIVRRSKARKTPPPSPH